MIDLDRDKIMQLGPVLRAAAEKWLNDDIDIFVAIPDEDPDGSTDNYLVAPMKLSMMTTIEEYGWEGEETVGGDCVLIIAENDVQRLGKHQLKALTSSADQH